ncbi:MAG: HlyD family efflux transporter periplasmic adaptor subunit [Bacillota bacterium]|jgi:putative membrane fusion protein
MNKIKNQQNRANLAAARSPHKKPRNKVLDVVAVIVIIAVLLAIAVAVKNTVAEKIVSYAQVETGKIYKKVQGEALLLRQETPITAPIAGEFTPQLTEGMRVKAATLIGTISQSNGQVMNIYSPCSGIVSYQVSEKKDIITAQNIEDLDIAATFSLLGQKSEETTGEAVIDPLGKGRKVAKVIDNLAQFNLVVRVPLNTEIPDENSLQFLVNDLSSDKDNQEAPLFSGKMSDTFEDSGSKYVVLEFLPQENYFYEHTYFSVQLVQSSFSGQIIPTSAITKEGGVQGVYTRYKNKVNFKAIEVIGIIDEKAAVNGLDIGDEVVVKPGFLSNKQKLK